MNTDVFLRHLVALDACDEAREWVAAQPDAATAWATCPRAGWLLWLLGGLHLRGTISRQTLVLAACACAETTLRNGLARDDRHRLSVEAARRWVLGEASAEEVRAYADDAAEAAVYDGAYFAYSAAYAAYAGAARDAVVAVDNVADFAGFPEASDAVRSAVPWDVVEAAILAGWCANELEVA